MQKNSIITALGPDDMEGKEYRDILKNDFKSLFAPKKPVKKTDSVSVFHDDLFLKKHAYKGTKIATWDGPDRRHLYGKGSVLDSAVYTDYLDGSPFAEYRFVQDKTDKGLIAKDMEEFYREKNFDVKIYELPGEEFSKIKDEMTSNPPHCIVCYTVDEDSREAKMLDEARESRESLRKNGTVDFL